MTSTVAHRLARFLPNRENRYWWLAGVAVALWLTFMALPVTFERRVADPVATEQVRQTARKNTVPIYTLDQSELTNAQRLLQRIGDVFSIPSLTTADRARALQSLDLSRYYLRNVEIPTLIEYSARFPMIREKVIGILERVLSRGVVIGGYGEGSFRSELYAYFDPRYTTQWSSVETMTIRVGSRPIPVADTLELDNAILEMERLVRTTPLDPQASPEDAQAIRALIQDLCVPFIRPNLIYNEEATKKEQEANAAAVPTQYKTLDQRPVSVWLGTFLVIALIGGLSGLFLAIHPITRTPQKTRPLLTLGSLLFVAVILIYFIVRIDHRSRDVDFPVLILPVAVTAALSSILIGMSFGTFATTFLTVLSAMMVGIESPSSVPQTLTLMASGLTATFTMAEVHHRRDLVLAGFYTTLVTVVVVFGATLVQADISSVELLRVLAWAFVSGLLVTALVPGLLPPFESLAGTATDMELLELTDMNHPLLLQLQKVAPGTFNHSLNVSRLAEGAAEAIGANALLARVGAYYHDIGKTGYPQYFIENQEGGPNPHDRLSPSMSARVIIAHVTDGLEMAKESKLPRSVSDLIPQHHGTSLIRVFYHKATEHGDLVDESEFRYPGPKPQSKVGAIMLLADSIEAASNARFKNMTGLGHKDCQVLVTQIVNQYMLDGQLDECDLTLNDLRLISNSFERTLLGMYHSRIEYPKGTLASAPTMRE